MKHNKRWTGLIAVLLLTVLVFCLSACGSAENSSDSGTGESGEENTYKIYYLDKSGTGVTSVDYQPVSSDSEALIEEFLERLSASDSIDYTAPISNFEVLGTSIDNGIVTIDFSKAYEELSVTSEALTRAAIVSTICEVPGVSGVAVTIEGSPLTGEDGLAVGAETSSDFILNLGKDINSYEKDRIKLYFANEKGDHLICVYRTVIYNSNISKDKLIVEELLKGPNGDGVYPTINPETAIINVTSRDGVCYVNFDKSFMTEPYSVTAEVAVYSIVDSLTELPFVSRVQISIDGDTTQSFLDFEKTPLCFSSRVYRFCASFPSSVSARISLL